MATISKSSKKVKDSTLTYKEYKLYRIKLIQAAELAFYFIEEIWKKYGSMLDSTDYYLIGLFFPTEEDYKSWEIVDYKNELEELRVYFAVRYKYNKEYQNLIKGAKNSKFNKKPNLS